MDQYVWTPVEMCRFALREKYYQPLRLYLYFAIMANGMTAFNKEIKEEAASHLDRSVRSVYRDMKSLISQKWVGKNPATGTHFIQAFEYIRQIENFTHKTAVRTHLKDLTSTKQFQGFCTAAVIGKILLLRNKKIREEERLNKNYDVRSRAFDLSPNRKMEVSASYLQEALKNDDNDKQSLSIGTCHNYKQYAAEAGYINITPNKLTIKNETLHKAFKWIVPDVPGTKFIQRSDCKGNFEIIRPDIVEPKTLYKFRETI